MSNNNPQQPNKYRGTDKYITYTVTRNRRPTLADYRQPETGNYYSLCTTWQVGKNPTTGTEGEIWMLSKIVANQGYWILVSSGAVGPLINIDVDASTPPGTDPVVADAGGTIIFTGAQVAAGVVGTNVLRSDSLVANSVTYEIQRSAATASPTLASNGVCHFDSASFSVDGSGFVTLADGVGATKFNVDASTPPGTDPVVPDSNGQVTVTGGQVAAGVVGANVIRTNSLAANTYTTEIQRSTAVGSTASANNGVSHFNSANFTVDANGFVSLSKAFSIVTQVFANSGTYTPTAGMVYCIAEVWGGGGGGGGCPSTSAGQVNASGGGGGGGYARKVLTAAAVGASQTITIGAGGAGGAGNNPGSNGGTTTFGAIFSATGGLGGASGTSNILAANTGSFGGTGVGGDVNVYGSSGGNSVAIFNAAVSVAIAGVGGDPGIGGGPGAVGGISAVGGNANGNTALSPGAGGSGSVCFPSAAQVTGGDGLKGQVVVTEYVFS